MLDFPSSPTLATLKAPSFRFETPAWRRPPGHVKLMRSAAASAAGQLDFALPGNYRGYRATFRRIWPATTPASQFALYMRVSMDGGATYLATSVYRTAGYFSSLASGFAAFGSTTIHAQLSGSIPSIAAANINQLVLDIQPGAAGDYAAVESNFAYGTGGANNTMLFLSSGRLTSLGRITNIRMYYYNGVTQDTINCAEMELLGMF